MTSGGVGLTTGSSFVTSLWIWSQEDKPQEYGSHIFPMLWPRNGSCSGSMHSYCFPYSAEHHESYSLPHVLTWVTSEVTAEVVGGQGQIHVSCMENSSGMYRPLK